MKVISGNEFQSTQKIAATIGFFDGVHLGHQHLIHQVVNAAKKENIASAVITFNQHPRKVVNPDYTPNLLTTYNERIRYIAQTGVDYCIVLDFTTAIAQLTAKQFIEQILHTKFNVQTLIIGYDHRFGKDRSEGFDDYVRYGNEIGIKTSKADVYQANSVTISSSYIRTALSQGEVGQAKQLLNRPYQLEGEVVRGQQIGRTIGFPTANIHPNDSEKIVPGKGVYVVKVEIDAAMYDAILNIGVRPTIDNANRITIEAHILDFNEDIYGKTVSLHFLEKLRDERKMNGLEELKQQIESDKQKAVSLLKTY